MKTFKLFVLAMLLTVPAFAASDVSVTMLGTYRVVPNPENSEANNAAGGSVRFEKPIYKELSAGIELEYLGRKYYDSVDDVKGSFGSLDGYGGMVEVIFRPEVNAKIHPYIFAGVGFYNWDFNENPFLQENNVKAEVDPAFAVKVGAGVGYKLNEKWEVGVEYSYFASEIPFVARDNKGVVWNVVGADGNLGNEEHRGSAFVRYWFN